MRGLLGLASSGEVGSAFTCLQQQESFDDEPAAHYIVCLDGQAAYKKQAGIFVEASGRQRAAEVYNRPTALLEVHMCTIDTDRDGDMEVEFGPLTVADFNDHREEMLARLDAVRIP